MLQAEDFLYLGDTGMLCLSSKESKFDSNNDYGTENEFNQPQPKKRKERTKRRRKTIKIEDDASISTTSSTPLIADLSLSFDPCEALDFELSDNDDDDDDDDEPFEGDLFPEEEIDWEFEVYEHHKSTTFTGLNPTQYTSETVKKCGRANNNFFFTQTNTVPMLLAFIPIDFIDNIAEWTTMKTNTSYYRYNILGVFCIWFNYGLVQLPSIDLLFTLVIDKVLLLLGIDKEHEEDLPTERKYNYMASKLQYNTTVAKEDYMHKNGRKDALYLICLLLELMQKIFCQGLIPPISITVDESLCVFKGMTFLKRYMPDKPKKFGFLEYALCTINGYFLCVFVHHVPGKKKEEAERIR